MTDIKNTESKESKVMLGFGAWVSIEKEIWPGESNIAYKSKTMKS